MDFAFGNGIVSGMVLVAGLDKLIVEEVLLIVWLWLNVVSGWHFSSSALWKRAAWLRSESVSVSDSDPDSSDPESSDPEESVSSGPDESDSPEPDSELEPDSKPDDTDPDEDVREVSMLLLFANNEVMVDFNFFLGDSLEIATGPPAIIPVCCCCFLEAIIIF
mmetsp:Transcript_12652/g.18260  ORF Transcript_12652/g.18260 Transcript_12652/m.18260 type:complete len:163 (-) Transcript_12652:384-872(-)